MKLNKKVNILSGLLLCGFLTSILFIYGCNEKGKSEFISYISQHLEEAEVDFSNEKWMFSVYTEGEEKKILEVCTEDGTKYFFESGYEGDIWVRLEQRIEDEKHHSGVLEIERKEEKILGVYWDPDDYGFLGVQYKLPDFELIDRWGDTIGAETEINQHKSMDEIKELYYNAKNIEQKLLEYVQGVEGSEK